MKKFKYKSQKNYISYLLTNNMFLQSTAYLYWKLLKKNDINLDIHALYNGLPRWFSGKESACQCRGQADVGSTPVSGRSPGERHGSSLQYSGLENPMDRGAWWATVQGIVKSWTRLSDWSHTCMLYIILHEAADLISRNCQMGWKAGSKR